MSRFFDVLLGWVIFPLSLALWTVFGLLAGSALAMGLVYIATRWFL